MEKDSLPVIKQPQSMEEELPVIKQPQSMEEKLPIIKQPQSMEEELPIIKQPQSVEEELPVIKPPQSAEDNLLAVQQQTWSEKEWPAADEAAFEPQAGVVNFCMECGMRLPKGALYCPYCGSEIYREDTSLRAQLRGMSVMDCVKTIFAFGCRKLLRRQ